MSVPLKSLFPLSRAGAISVQFSLLAFAGTIAAQAQSPPAATTRNAGPAVQLPVVAAQAQKNDTASSPAQQTAASMSPSAATRNAPGTLSPEISANPAASTSTADVPQLTLDQVIARVLNANPAIVQARLARQRAHILIQVAVGQSRPQIAASAYDTYSSTPASEAQNGQTPTVTSTTSIPVIQDSAFSNVGTSVSSSSAAGTVSTGDAESTTTSSGTTIVPVGSVPSSGESVVSGSSGAGSSSTSGSTSGGGTSTTTTGTTSDAVSEGKLSPRDSGTGTGTTTTTTGSDFISTRQRVNNYAADATATQILDVFGIAKANIDAAKRNANFSDLDVTRLENDTALNAKDTYFAVLKAVSDVATDTELLGNANAVLKNAQINYSAGASPQFDVISAQASVSSAQAALISAQNELQVEKAILDNLMSLPTDHDFTLAQVPVTTVPADTEAAPLIATANAARPEVLESDLTKRIARDLTKISLQEVLPSFGLSGGVDYQPYLTTGSSHYTGFVTAAVSVPLYTGGTGRADVNAAKINETSQQSVGIQIRQDVELEVKSALVNVITYQNLVTADTAAVAEYRDALRIANVRYTAGVGTLLDVTNAEANLANSESNLNSAVFQQQSAYAALVRAQGRR